MDGLQRSTTSFRRQGSSGLIWDDKFLSGELNQVNKHNEVDDDKEKEDLKRPSSIDTMRSDGGERTYRTGKAPPPTMDPPSPKFSGCCGFFGNPVAAPAHKTKPRRRKYS
ncbi:hypothetical protein ACOSP7_015522 [Xanthoceras sorbifolium]|uniref:MAPK kinase substrate protein n=1 Tax=Xanthoceras sorbifolium TaxID=99658 RepID=A0ABQ8I6X3_9ROSI|nr:hypothetical protein JRO89_XS04G0246400 [Xanthoceras sorbifolium]